MMDNQTGTEGEVRDEQYLVDRILNKRIIDKKVQYYIRWKGYGKEDNSWVSKADIWPGLVEDYERELRVKRQRKAVKKSRRSSTTTMKWKQAPKRTVVLDSDPDRRELQPSLEASAFQPVESLPTKRLKGWSKVFEGPSSRDSNNNKAVYPVKTGFARGLLPEKIMAMGSHESTGMVMLLMRWKNSPQPEFVPYQEAKEKCPQVLIAYFEERTFWVPPSFWAQDG